MEGGPYRERPKFLLCPRCGEMLERAFDAVHTCLRCEGVWLAPISIEKAFGTTSWPEGQNSWWRSALQCPECAAVGETTMMGAEMANTVLLDRCRAHGIWLDRGELGRLMGGALADEHGDDDLAALRERLAIVDVELDKLLQRRSAWRADAETRKRTASEYRAWLDAEQAKRHAAEAAERARLDTELERRMGELARIAAERKRLAAAEAVVAAERAARELAEREEKERRLELEHAQQERERVKQKAREVERAEVERRRQRLGDMRVQASAHAARLEARIVELRKQLHDAEAELAGARTRLRGLDADVAALERRDPT